MSNKTFVEPFDYGTVYPILGTILSVAIILNIVSCVIMMKNKDLRKHRQFFVYTTISLTEVFIDALYIVKLFWRRRDVEYFCMIIFLLVSLGREKIQLHLLSLCIERCFALNVSLNNLFRKMVTNKGRLTTFIFCLTLSIIIIAPPVFLYADKYSYACGPATLFGKNSRSVLRYYRTVFSLQVVSVFGMYLYVTKKVSSLTAPNAHSTDISHSRTVIVKPRRKLETVFNDSSQETKQVTLSSGASTSKTVQGSKGKLQILKQSKHPHHQKQRDRQYGQWKPRTLSMLRSAIFTTVIPSLPTLGLQIGDYINPRFMNTALDVFISLCNVLHAIIFPLIFIVTVKKNARVCCKKSGNANMSSN